MDDSNAKVRPIITIISLCAWIGFQVLRAVGYDIPPEINGLWVPVIWWYRDRTVLHNKEKEDGK